jgi:RNA polymerase sigma factor (sigma-70 family)
MKEIAVNMRLYNNRLRQRRLGAGLNYRQLSEVTNIPQSVCGEMERITYDPFKHSSVGIVVGWKKAVIMISEFWRTVPDELFPEALRAARQFEAELTVDAADIALLSEYASKAALPLNDEDAYTGNIGLRAQVRKTLGTLSKREAGILRMRFGIGSNDEMTLEEVGTIIGVSRDRIRQIEARALRKLRHPSRSRQLSGLGPVMMQDEIERRIREEEEERQRCEEDEANWRWRWGMDEESL